MAVFDMICFSCSKTRAGVKCTLLDEDVGADVDVEVVLAFLLMVLPLLFLAFLAFLVLLYFLRFGCVVGLVVVGVVGVLVGLVLVVSASFYSGFIGISVVDCGKGVHGSGKVEMRVVLRCCT